MTTGGRRGVREGWGEGRDVGELQEGGWEGYVGLEEKGRGYMEGWGGYRGGEEGKLEWEGGGGEGGLGDLRLTPPS